MNEINKSHSSTYIKRLFLLISQSMRFQWVAMGQVAEFIPLVLWLWATSRTAFDDDRFTGAY